MCILLENRHSERASNPILVQLRNLWVSSPRVSLKTVIGKEQEAEVPATNSGPLKILPFKEKQPEFVENCTVLNISSKFFQLILKIVPRHT